MTRYVSAEVKKIRAVKPPAMDTALCICTYQEQVMNSYGMRNQAPFIPKLSAGSHARLVSNSASHQVKSQNQISARRKAITEVPRRLLQPLQANAYTAP